MKNPCYMCEKRALGCHSFCKEHKSFREENNSRREKIRVENTVSAYEVHKQNHILSRQAKKKLKDGKDRRR